MTVPARTASTVTVITGCAAWAALRREPCPIAGDYPERYRAVSRIPRRWRDQFRRARTRALGAVLCLRVWCR